MLKNSPQPEESTVSQDHGSAPVVRRVRDQKSARNHKDNSPYEGQRTAEADTLDALGRAQFAEAFSSR